ncbi:hypothetical protein MMC21_008036 [Puttea exsequens]|nr:hypothetical protein [Puttea exsequens]
MGAPRKDQTQCTITNDWFDRKDVKAAHIVPMRLGSASVDYIFTGFGSRLVTPDNFILMHTTVERAFDKGLFVFIAAKKDEYPIKTWKIQVTNDSAIHSNAGRVQFGDLNGKEVVWMNYERPASKFLYFHFVVSLLVNKRDRNDGWERHMTSLTTGKPFATPGAYMRKSMLLYIAKIAGDLSPDEEVAILGQEEKELFEHKKKINDTMAEEIARRVIETVDLLKEDDEEYEEEDEENNEDDEEDEEEEEHETEEYSE